MPKPLTKEEFLTKIEKKFGDKFTYTLPEEFSLNKNITVHCPIHGDLITSGRSFLYSKGGCNKCGLDLRSQHSKTTQTIPWRSRVCEFNTIHKNKYTYSINHNGGNRSKIKIHCDKHGEFQKLMSAHLAGQGCPSCQKESTKKFKNSLINQTDKAKIAKINRTAANRKKAEEKQMPLETAQQLVLAKHGNKFFYDWSSYKGWSHKLKITCPDHGDFYQSCKDHASAARGCPSCARISKSRLEDEWLTSFDVIYRQYKINLDGKLIKVDGYNPITNTVYEFLGDYWHGHPIWHSKLNGINANNKISFIELFEQTKIRFDKIKNMGYNIVYVWENDIRNKNITSRIFYNNLEV